MTINYLGELHTIDLGTLHGNCDIDCLSKYSFDEESSILSVIKSSRRVGKVRQFFRKLKVISGCKTRFPLVDKDAKPLMKSNGYLSLFFPLTSFKIKEDTIAEMLHTRVSSTRLNTNSLVLSPQIIQHPSPLIESPFPGTPASLPYARVRTSNIAAPTASSSLIIFSDPIDT